MPNTILSHLLFAVFFLVVCKFLVLFVSSPFSLLFVLPAEVILTAIFFPIKSHVASAIYNIYPFIRVILTLSSISGYLLFLSVNHISVDKSSVFVVLTLLMNDEHW